MSQIPRVKPNVRAPSSSPDSVGTDPARVPSTTFTPQDVTELARTLAAHGGGEASVDLALDLVLHELVEQARDATGATGAAVALLRDDEMVCRATTGTNAPDLGVRVETSSGLAGACVMTGTIQHCTDTDEDPRVNAELCRQLGVRSMLIAPLVLEKRVWGILEVFSPAPHAFGGREFEAVRAVASQIAESKRELDNQVSVAPEVHTGSVPKLSRQTPNAEPETLADNIARSSKTPREALSSILFFLVIAAAVALGLVIGWGAASHGHKSEAESIPSTSPLDTAQINEKASDSSATPKIPPQADPKRSTANNAVPEGGLLVTQNGRVIYRSTAERSRTGAPNGAIDHHVPRLIHRVEPQYPDDAKTRHIQGAVVLELRVLDTGEVANVAVISGDPLLTQAAIKAVKQWRYQPYAKDGKAVESQARVTINFVLPPA